MKKFTENLDGPLALFVIIVAVFIATALLIADSFYTHPYTVYGYVVDKQYLGAETTVGFGLDNRGQPVTIMSSSSEEFKLFVMLRGEITSYEVNIETYYAYEVGDVVEILCKQSNIFGTINCNNSGE